MLLEAPPEIPESSGGGMGAALTYLPMIAGAGAMALLFMGPGARPIAMVAGGMYALSMVGMMAGQVGRGGQEKARKINKERRDYARYLSQVRRKVRKAAEQQRQALLWGAPDPASLWSIAVSNRLWERRPTDRDFGTVRVAVGAQRLAVTLVPAETKPVEDLEPVSAGALRRFVRTHSTVPDLPVAISVRGFARVDLQGDRVTIEGLTRAVAAHLAVFHGPEDLRIAICCPPERVPAWDWVKWLPHALHPTESDGAGPTRLWAPTLTGVERLIGDLSSRARFAPGGSPSSSPHYVIFLDGGEVGADSQLAAAGIDGVTLIDLRATSLRAGDRGTLRLKVAKQELVMLTRSRSGDDTTQLIGRPDDLSPVETEMLARGLAPYRMGTAAAAQDSLTRSLGLAELLGLGDPASVDTAVTWRPRPGRDRLRVPVGLGPAGEVVDLDIKEAAQQGMGPHGLLVGATGSGKSELLRTLVLGLALTHSSEVLNFVLVDFKGGATFASLDALPHTSALITNLADDLAQVDRMRDAIEGELNRRQELLRDAGDYANLKDYEAARLAGVPLAPLPSLFVVVDEFGELLTAKPDFLDLFIMIGRIGRSLGVHLLLASQRLEEGRLRGLDTYLSYRVGLRTFSGMESRVVLGVPDAYNLPNDPGHGYLKIDSNTMLRFKAAYVSGPYTGPGELSAGVVGAIADRMMVYRLDPVAKPALPAGPEQAASDQPAKSDKHGPSVMDVMVDRLTGRGMEAHRVWLPPLVEPATLDQLLPPLVIDPRLGLTVADAAARGRLTVPIGLVDKPYFQRRDPLWLDVSGAGGHVVVVGGPQSGKSTVLRTLISGLALTHTPQEVQFYCLDFGGGTMTGMVDLPHIGAVAGRRDAELIRRTMAEITALMEQRETVFAERRIDSMATYRRMRAAGTVTDDPHGDVFLVIDGWGLVRTEMEQLETQVTALAARGLSYGIHVVISAQRWMEVRPALRDLVQTRVELRLGDPSESEIDRRSAVNVPEKTPGRGLTRDKLHFLSALPRIDGAQQPETLTDGAADFAARLERAWPGQRAPRTRLLPRQLPYPQLVAAARPDAGLALGIDEEALAPVSLDLSADPHLVVFGDTQCGKTNLMRVVIQGVVQRYTPEQAKIVLIDYRYGLLDMAGVPHKLAHGFASNHTPQIVQQLVAGLSKRLPPPDIAPERLRARDWWNGPELFLIVDDYDLVVTGPTNPFLPLLELLPLARDIGMHMIIARSSGGAGRAMFEPVIQRLRENGTPALIMSGNKDEGALFGNVKPEPLPAGRGRLVTRRGISLVQTAFLPAAQQPAPAPGQ